MYRGRRVTRKSGLASGANATQWLGFVPSGLGQSCPERCPHSHEPPALGPPLSIRDVARLIGCSPWTVRQTLIPQGLPVFRSGASGKLIFYRDQVVRWIEFRQGGNA
jgi:hypothetical protein